MLINQFNNVMILNNAKELKILITSKTKLKENQVEVVRKTNGICIFYTFNNTLHKEMLQVAHFPKITDTMQSVLIARLMVKLSPPKHKPIVVGDRFTNRKPEN